MKTAILLIILICSVHANSFAVGRFYERKAEGWFWYEDKVKNKDKKQEGEFVPQGATSQERNQHLREELNRLREIAVDIPTYENVSRFARLQKYMLGKSYDFSQTYKEVMQTDPILNETTTIPISQVGGQIYRAEKQKEMEKQIKAATSKYGLFYFYKSDCPFCEKFIPIVKMFTNKYGFELVPVSLDGRKHPAFPNSQTNHLLGDRLNVQKWPALYLIEAKGEQIIPVVFGYTGMSHIEESMSFILNRLKEGRR